MEKKMVYVAVSNMDYGENVTVHFDFDLDECRDALDAYMGHLTKRELKSRTHAIEGYLIDAEDGVSAKEAYTSYFEERDLPDPDFYESVDPIWDRSEARDIAGNLFEGGWRSADRDEIMEEYDMRAENADLICEYLEEFESEEEEEA